MAAIAQRHWSCRGDAGAIMALLSPYFLANCVGRMSHPACCVFLAGACLFCFDGLRTLRIRPFLWMLLLITAAFQVRPYTAAAIGAVLGPGSVWYLRRTRLFFPVLAWGALFGAVCAASFLLCNKLYTGSYWIMLHELAHLSPTNNGVTDFDFSSRQLLHNLGHQTRWAVQETVFC